MTRAAAPQSADTTRANSADGRDRLHVKVSDTGELITYSKWAIQQLRQRAERLCRSQRVNVDAMSRMQRCGLTMSAYLLSLRPPLRRQTQLHD